MIDDTFTTGAHLHSAAHAVAQAGGYIVGALVVARKFTPNDRYPFTIDVWERQTAQPFSFDSLMH